MVAERCARGGPWVSRCTAGGEATSRGKDAHAGHPDEMISPATPAPDLSRLRIRAVCCWIGRAQAAPASFSCSGVHTPHWAQVRAAPACALKVAKCWSAACRWPIPLHVTHCGMGRKQACRRLPAFLARGGDALLLTTTTRPPRAAAAAARPCPPASSSHSSPATTTSSPLRVICRHGRVRRVVRAPSRPLCAPRVDVLLTLLLLLLLPRRPTVATTSARCPSRTRTRTRPRRSSRLRPPRLLCPRLRLRLHPHLLRTAVARASPTTRPLSRRPR